MEEDVDSGSDKPHFPDPHSKDKKELADSHKKLPFEEPEKHEGVSITPEKLQRDVTEAKAHKKTKEEAGLRGQRDIQDPRGLKGAVLPSLRSSRAS